MTKIFKVTLVERGSPSTPGCLFIVLLCHLLPFPDDDVRMSVETLKSLSILLARVTSNTLVKEKNKLTATKHIITIHTHQVHYNRK